MGSTALRRTVFVGDDRWHHKPLYPEIVTRVRETGLAGATVLHGGEGYGASSFVHTDRLRDVADGLPVAEGTTGIDEVEVLRYQGKQPS